jgi:hypothetical protein
MQPGCEYDVQRLPCGIGTDLIRVDPDPGIDSGAVAFRRGLTLPYGRLRRCENVSRCIVRCRVCPGREPRHAISLFQYHRQRGNAPRNLFCARPPVHGATGACSRSRMPRFGAGPLPSGAESTSPHIRAAHGAYGPASSVGTTPSCRLRSPPIVGRRTQECGCQSDVH